MKVFQVVGVSELKLLHPDLQAHEPEFLAGEEVVFVEDLDVGE